MLRFALLATTLSGALTFSSVCFAQTIMVDLNGGGDYTEIQSAIDAAVDGDTVLVKPGEYVINESITFGWKAITVRSENGAQETTIRMLETPADLTVSTMLRTIDGGAEGMAMMTHVTPSRWTSRGSSGWPPRTGTPWTVVPCLTGSSSTKATGR